MDKHIFLMGFMASGKSTIAKLIAQEVAMPFIDLDSFIEDEEQRTITDIFQQDGEPFFRSLEASYLAKVCQFSTPHVVALGGGTPCTSTNIQEILKSGISFFLHVPESILVERLINSDKRPIVAGKSASEIRDIVAQKMANRRKWYSQAAYTVDGSTSKKILAKEIINIIDNTMNTSVDILAIGVHPDDIELCASGTLLKHIAQGKSVAICDLTSGELGTRGSGPLRLVEAENSREIMGVQSRTNLGMADGFFRNTKENVLKLVEVIRSHKPTIVLANALSDRHPDHGRAAKLISDACFYAGLRKIQTDTDAVWRPRAIYHYIQDRFAVPDIVVDITPFMDKKFEAILAYKSQFFDPESPEPSTPISGQDFLEYIKSQDRVYGRYIGVTYAEGFKVERPVGVEDLTELY